jgi:hypothetical protein
VIGGVTEVEHITTKQDMSRWTRAHADVPGIRWSVFAGPGGTMIIVEHEEDRCSLARATDVRSDNRSGPAVTPDLTVAPAPAPVAPAAALGNPDAAPAVA